jgi:hypothetical protein
MKKIKAEEDDALLLVDGRQPFDLKIGDTVNVFRFCIL